MVDLALGLGLAELLEEEDRQVFASEEEIEKFGLFSAKNVFQPVKDKIRSLLGYNEEPEEKKVFPAEETKKKTPAEEPEKMTPDEEPEKVTPAEDPEKTKVEAVFRT